MKKAVLGIFGEEREVNKVTGRLKVVSWAVFPNAILQYSTVQHSTHKNLYQQGTIGPLLLVPGATANRESKDKKT